MKCPVFVVVGHVNRGKSSIVSTLAADDSVRIDPRPGTTVHCREYPAVVAGQRLYTLVDTPGFERPRQVLAWLKSHEAATHERRDVVAAFVREHAGGATFRQECELLLPILDGAAILYVVDGSKPPSPKDEAEMEILRWTTQPRLALVNPIEKPAQGGADHTPQWRKVLDQYFNLVRVFDAHEADFQDRLRLLRTLQEMDPEVVEPLAQAIRSLWEDRRASIHEGAVAVADMLVDMLTLVQQQRLDRDATAPSDTDKETLAKKYFEALRWRERQGHRQLQEILSHRRLEVTEPNLAAVEDDLFSDATWIRFGLSGGQVVTAGATTGGATGLAIDVAVGGHSLLLGTLIGGAVGGLLGFFGARQLPAAKIRGIPLGGRLLKIGPMHNANFPWIVLDRALLLYDSLARRAHARRDPVMLADTSGPQGIVAQLPRDVRSRLDGQYARLRKAPPAVEVDALRGELAEAIESVLQQRVPVELPT